MDEKLIQELNQISTELQLLKSKDIRDIKDAIRVLSVKIDRLTAQDEQSESIDQLTAALAKAKLEANPLVASGSFKIKDSIINYSEMVDYLEAYQEALCKNGLVITFTPQVGRDNQLILVTKLTHTSGQWMKSVLPAEPNLDDAKMSEEKAYGSLLTSLKRYAYAAMMGR